MGYKTIERKLNRIYNQFQDDLEEPMREREQCNAAVLARVGAARAQCESGCAGIEDSDARADCARACYDRFVADRAAGLKICSDEYQKKFEKARKKMEAASGPLQKDLQRFQFGRVIISDVEFEDIAEYLSVTQYQGASIRLVKSRAQLTAQLAKDEQVGELILLIHGNEGSLRIGRENFVMGLLANDLKNARGSGPMTVSDTLNFESCMVAGETTALVTLARVLGNTPRVFGWNYFHVYGKYEIPKGASAESVTKTLGPVDDYLVPGSATVKDLQTGAKKAKQGVYIEWFTESEEPKYDGRPRPGHFRDHKRRSSARPVPLTPAKAPAYDRDNHGAPVGRSFDRVDIHMRE